MNDNVQIDLSSGQLADADRDDTDSHGSPLRRVHKAFPARLFNRPPSSYASVDSDDVEMNSMGSGPSAGRPRPKGFSTGLVTFGTSQDNVDSRGKPFMTIDPSERADFILDVIRYNWALQLPELLICILGSEKLDMKYDTEKEICKGLVETVLSTDVWLFTGGLQCGLIQSIGEALNEHATGRAFIKHRRLVAVGVAPLGRLKEKGTFKRQDLVNKQSPVIQLNYRPTKQVSGEKLEPNHTHFILVGSPSEHGRGGIEAKARNQLIHKISTMKIEGTSDINASATIPAVYLLFGGDVTVFDTLEYATNNSIPIVYCPYTKGAAQVLDEIMYLDSERYSSTSTEKFDKAVYRLVKEEFHLSSHQAKRRKEQIERIIKHRHLIYGVSKTDNINGAILNALMQAMVTELQSNNQTMMRLAVIWDRVDLAMPQFDQTSKIWQDTSFVNKILHDTLVKNQHDFVKFLIETGRIDMKEFLSFDELRELYGAVNRGICLGDVGCLLKELICDGYDTDYLSCNEHYEAEKKEGNTFRDPHKELFLWAVLQDHIQIAMVFWKLGKPSVGSALVANKLLLALSHHQEVTDAQKAASMYQHAKEFQQMAVDILNMCYEEDRRLTSDLLVRIMPEWGGATCLDIAATAKSKLFISQVAVQNLLCELWMGRLFVLTHDLKIGLCVLLPLLSVWLITFKEDQDDSYDALKKMHPVCLPATAKTQNKHGCTTSQHKPHASSQLDQEWGRLSWLVKLVMFFEAPVVRFSYNVIAQVLFLALFSYILLCNFHQEEVSGWEIVLMVWVFTIFTDEIRQILQNMHGAHIRLRIKAWLSGYWNTVDLISLVLFAVGVALRFHPLTFDAARIVLALDLIVFYFRILQFCAASKHLGPKLIMITKMMLDLISFISILAVFMISYGVACQAILYPNSSHPQTIARGVLYRSYFQLYGELFLDSDEGNCATNQTQLASGLDPCPRSSWFATVSLAVYLFISNILLLNLLIAMLNYTFTAVQDNTDAYWKYQRYQLVKEYYWRPAIVPPFIVVAHLFLLVRHFWDCCFPECRMYRSPNLMGKKMKGRQAEMMTAWEKVKCRDYEAEKKAKATKSRAADQKIEQMEKKLDDLYYKVSEYFDGSRLSQSVENAMQKCLANDSSLSVSRSPDQVSLVSPEELFARYETQTRSPRAYTQQETGPSDSLLSP